MKIKWLGHACFLLTSENGTRVLTDPFDDQVGYKLPEVEADIVTTSHDHYDHNAVDVVKGNFTHINKPGSFEEKGIKITGISTFHDEAQGSKRGDNIVYVFEIDGIRICHCGDLGHPLSKEQIDEIGEIDVLLLPVGGIYTIDAAQACEVMESLKPVITIPMHFQTPVLKFSLGTVDDFIAAAGGGEKINKQEIEITKDGLTNYSDIIILDYE